MHFSKDLCCEIFENLDETSQLDDKLRLVTDKSFQKCSLSLLFTMVTKVLLKKLRNVPPKKVEVPQQARQTRSQLAMWSTSLVNRVWLSESASILVRTHIFLFAFN